MTKVQEADRATYYRAALSCLRFIEQRRPTGRRFGQPGKHRPKGTRPRYSVPRFKPL